MIIPRQYHIDVVREALASYLARTEQASVLWRRDFVRTFLERDIPQLDKSGSPRQPRRGFQSSL